MSGLRTGALIGLALAILANLAIWYGQNSAGMPFRPNIVQGVALIILGAVIGFVAGWLKKKLRKY